MQSTRRRFLKTTGAVLAGAASCVGHCPRLFAEPKASNPLPRWRGFNLLDFFQAFSGGYQSQGQVPEKDCQLIRDLGFDFVRLPLDYWLWIDTDWRKTRKLTKDDMFKIDESMLDNIDRTIDLCDKHDLHLHINFHRAPGYCINNPDREPAVLWNDADVEEAFVFHWDLFAKRYATVSPELLSFNLVNEAPAPREGYMSREDYRRVMTRGLQAVRRHSPDRIVVVDGLRVGTEVVTEMIPTGAAQSVHGYAPAQISHYRAGWVDKNSSFPEPTWPIRDGNGNVTWDRARLESRYAPWGELARSGIGVHCGEVGCYNKTPHDVCLAWMSDVMEILHGHEIGYALWNFRGSFGILDSGRTDVQYEDFHGHKLDRKMLTLLQKH